MPYQIVAHVAVYVLAKFVVPKVSRAVKDVREHAEGERLQAEYQREVAKERENEARRRRAQASTAGASAGVGREEDEMNRRHDLLQVGMSSSGVLERMGKPDHVDTLGNRELWNYGLGHAPARWQALLEDGNLIGAYTRGAYRFQRGEATA